MRFAAMTSALCGATMLAVASTTSALAQTSAPPAPSSGMPPGMMQMMPPEMMQMMQRMHGGALPRMAMMGGSPMAPAGAIQNVEGHIAFLKAELKITDSQQKPWDLLAEALRTNARQLSATPGTAMGGMMGAADKKMPLASRLEQQEKLLALQLEALKRSRTALEALNAMLSDEQKKLLDELI